MEITLTAATKVLHGNPLHEYYILEIKNGSALLMRTDSKIYNDGYHYQQGGCECGKDKPYYPYWAGLDELYVSCDQKLME